MLSGAQKAYKNNAAFRHQHKIQIRVSELPRLSVYWLPSCRDSTLLTFLRIYVTQSFWSHKSIVLVLFSFLFIVLLIGTSRWAGASSSSLGHGPGISTKFKTSCSSNSIWSCKYDPVHSWNKNVTEIICFELQQQNFVILIAHHYRLDRLTYKQKFSGLIPGVNGFFYSG